MADGLIPGGFPACQLYFVEPSSRELLDYLLRCEGFLWADKHILPEMLSWVRWTQKQVRHRQELPTSCRDENPAFAPLKGRPV